MDKLTKEELANIQGLVSEFNQVKMQLGDEKPTQERKRKKAAAVKRHLKKISRDEAKRKRLY